MSVVRRLALWVLSILWLIPFQVCATETARYVARPLDYISFPINGFLRDLLWMTCGLIALALVAWALVAGGRARWWMATGSVALVVPIALTGDAFYARMLVSFGNGAGPLGWGLHPDPVGVAAAFGLFATTATASVALIVSLWVWRIWSSDLWGSAKEALPADAASGLR